MELKFGALFLQIKYKSKENLEETYFHFFFITHNPILKKTSIRFCSLLYLKSVGERKGHPYEHKTFEEIGREGHHEHVGDHEPHLLRPCTPPQKHIMGGSP